MNSGKVSKEVTNDNELKELIFNGNIRGLEILYKRYFSLVVKTIYYVIRDKLIAEDIAQDLFLKLWNKKEAIIKLNNIKAYLLIASKNMALDYLEKSKTYNKRQQQYLEIEFKPSYQPLLSQPDKANQLKVEIEKYLNELAPRCRLIFALNRFEGLSNDEISEYLNISKRTVETQMTKALKLLREKMKDKIHQYLVSFVIVALILYFLFKI